MTDIFYFSSTGNSFVVARDVANNIKAKLIPIPSTLNKDSILVEEDSIGIVFPVYFETYGGIPIIVTKFVRKLREIKGKYIFAICTYGSGSIITLNTLDNQLKQMGGKLSAGITVNMPENIADSRFNYPTLQQRMFDTWKSNIDNVCDFIVAQKKGRFDAPNVMVGRLWSLSKIIGLPELAVAKNKTLYVLQKGSSSSSDVYEELIPFTDRSFRTNDKCNGCGICVKVCPVSNIQMQGKRPEWQHHCELCLACLHWCPNHAIQNNIFPEAVTYHHPEVKILDIINEKGKNW
jgi:ferredoxin/flavodoxin